jgi:hypothetical protein
MSMADQGIVYWTCPHGDAQIVIRDSLAEVFNFLNLDVGAYWPAWPRAEELVERHECEAHRIGIEAAA